MKAELVEEINDGKLTPVAEHELVTSFAKNLKEDVLQRFHRNKTDKMDKRFTEFILIEAVRALLDLPPVTFYNFLRSNKELRSAMGLKHLRRLDSYSEF
ncbi:hypothetical protein C9439_00465 [archaeon SCG-AAA382B04]|nr:hypothetical protein C9439_00465 [archaeon SCG-AAA382B04]